MLDFSRELFRKGKMNGIIVLKKRFKKRDFSRDSKMLKVPFVTKKYMPNYCFSPEQTIVFQNYSYPVNESSNFIEKTRIKPKVESISKVSTFLCYLSSDQ